MFIQGIKTTLAATLLASTLSATAAYAGGGAGGSGDDASSVIIYKKDGSSVAAKGRKNKKTFTITKRNKEGKVVSRKRVKKNRPASAKITNPDGSSREVRRTRDGGKVIIDRNAKGRITKKVRVPKRSSSWISSTDPRTGETRIAGRTAKGVRFLVSLGALGLSFSH